MPIPVDPPPPGAFLAVIGIVLYLIALVAYALPVGECDKCPHCREERLKRAGKWPPPNDD